MTPLRVLVVDDSALCRTLLRELLEGDPEIVVVGEAADGAGALRLIRVLRPDLATIDIEMPTMGGLETIERIMAEHPLPLLVVTALPAEGRGGLAFQAMQRGALDLAAKPAAGDARAARALQISAKRLGRVPVVRHLPRHAAPALAIPAARAAGAAVRSLVGLGASAGGPAAIAAILGALPRDFPACIALVQHLPPGFTEPFRRFLATGTELRIIVAHLAVTPEPGTVVVAPDHRHLVAVAGGALASLDAPPSGGHRPAVDVLFRSLAAVYGARAVGVLLTGIGSDGAAGLGAMRAAGALTLAQDEATSAVFGMPLAARDAGAVEQMLPLDALAPALLHAIGGPS